ncbi:unnamed protein product [Toxocara canis]|uniref:Secreted protein n=1 Tax=Toxocara canis TaxID=6265 RepID=A0A183UTH9_TOXCA|nr:unnamed protein product [Toxocara canis]
MVLLLGGTNIKMPSRRALNTICFFLESEGFCFSLTKSYAKFLRVICFFTRYTAPTSGNIGTCALSRRHLTLSEAPFAAPSSLMPRRGTEQLAGVAELAPKRRLKATRIMRQRVCSSSLHWTTLI